MPTLAPRHTHTSTLPVQDDTGETVLVLVETPSTSSQNGTRGRHRGRGFSGTVHVSLSAPYILGKIVLHKYTYFCYREMVKNSENYLNKIVVTRLEYWSQIFLFVRNFS